MLLRQRSVRVVGLGLLTFVAAWCSLLALGGQHAWAGTLDMTACTAYGDSGQATDVAGPVWQASGSASLSAANRCGQGGSFQILPGRGPKAGDTISWHTVTPPSIQITFVANPVYDDLIDPNTGDGFSASFFWAGGTQAITPYSNCCGGMYYGTDILRNIPPSRYFGWQVTCMTPSCGEPLQILDVNGIGLQAVDNTPPNVAALGPGNIWYQTGRWVRGGNWPASFQASADDGICAMQAIIGNNVIPGPTTATLNQHSWTQCPPSPTLPLTVDTTKYANGDLPIRFSAGDAASPPNDSSPREILHVDNAPVALTLSGQTDALSTAGTQYVTASATAGPSGVASIDCSTDGAPYQSFAGSTEEIPVQGIGPHHIICYATNDAIDYQGSPAVSATESWSLDIRQPSASAVSFARIVGQLKCHKIREVERLPAHWVKVYRHGKPKLVERPARNVVHKVVRCHAAVVVRRVCRGGHCKKQRVVVLPHAVAESVWHARFGRRTVVSGWLGTPGGITVGGQQVDVMTAPDDGSNRFTQAAVVTTNADGVWTADLPAGPSRVVEAVYPGSSTIEPATSQQIKLVVPAKIKVHVSRHAARWGGTISIFGRVIGGYIPSGKLLRLRIGVAGVRGTVGIPNVRRNGDFRATWTFSAGRGVVRYWFSVSTLKEADYPFAPASSRRVYVTVRP
jgi:hypothetical protein